MIEMENIRKNREDEIKSGLAIPIIKDLYRAQLINWLISIHALEQMKAETLHITIAIVDKGLICQDVSNFHELYLLGITALFIACKYEEVE